FDPLKPGPSETDGIWTTTPAAESEVPDTIHIGSFNGTSAAVPMVAGVAALILAVKPTLTAEEVRNIIRRSARRIDRRHPDWRPLPSSHKGFDPNGKPHHPRYGYGLLDAEAAVNAV